jgi:putative phosphonate metabolism protein
LPNFPVTAPTDSPRYAVYFAPPADSGLWRLAQRWLGRDCARGSVLEQPPLDGWNAAEIAAATESPRHYGFHATLKAPFRLAPERTPRALHEAVAGFAVRQRPFQAPPLKVSAIGAFIALTLSAPSAQMQALAAAAVEDLDGFRAPLSDRDLQRRLKAGLSERQQAMLQQWGYPYVMQEFRFHMTLTGALSAPAFGAERRDRLQTQLTALFRAELREAIPVREICLYSQAASDQPFLLVDRFPLGTAPAARDPAEEQTTP